MVWRIRGQSALVKGAAVPRQEHGAWPRHWRQPPRRTQRTKTVPTHNFHGRSYFYTTRDVQIRFKCTVFVYRNATEHLLYWEAAQANIPLNSLPSFNISSAAPAFISFPLPSTTQ